MGEPIALPQKDWETFQISKKSALLEFKVGQGSVKTVYFYFAQRQEVNLKPSNAALVEVALCAYKSSVYTIRIPSSQKDGLFNYSCTAHDSCCSVCTEGQPQCTNVAFKLGKSSVLYEKNTQISNYFQVASLEKNRLYKIFFTPLNSEKIILEDESWNLNLRRPLSPLSHPMINSTITTKVDVVSGAAGSPSRAGSKKPSNLSTRVFFWYDVQYSSVNMFLLYKMENERSFIVCPRGDSMNCLVVANTVTARGGIVSIGNEVEIMDSFYHSYCPGSMSQHCEQTGAAASEVFSPPVSCKSLKNMAGKNPGNKDVATGEDSEAFNTEGLIQDESQIWSGRCKGIFFVGIVQAVFLGVAITLLVIYYFKKELLTRR